MNKKEYIGIKKTSYIYTIFFVTCVVGMMLVAPDLLYLMGGSKYMEAKIVIPPVMMGYYFVFVYSLFSNIEQFEKKTIGMSVATCSAAIINIILNMLFIPLYGYVAAAYTTLVCYMLLSVFHYFLVRRMGFQGLYDIRFILSVSFLLLVFSYGLQKIYKFWIVRLVLCIVYVLVVFIFIVLNKKKIGKLISRKEKKDEE